MQILGNKYGRLTIIGGRIRRKSSESSKQIRTYVKAVCECGIEGEYLLELLKSGHSSSCGCFNKESTAKRNSERGGYRKEMLKHPIYRTWSGMKQRCGNTNDKAYKYYGARGIVVCNEWANSFDVFYDWSIKNGWRKGLELDRENNDGNYEPSNCRWTTRIVNVRNRRGIKLNINTASQIRTIYSAGLLTQKDIAVHFGINPNTVSRIVSGERWK